MEYLLDTNICIYIIKQKPTSVLEKFQQYSPDQLGISSITLAELRYGVSKSIHQEKNVRALNQFLIPLNILGFDYEASLAYGKIRADLEKKGTPIGIFGYANCCTCVKQ